MADTTLYFAYASFLDPDRIHDVAPGAEFLFTAHYPETRLVFVESPDGEATPSLIADSGHTVWGGVFEIPGTEIDALTRAEKEEGRVADWNQRAVDREGNKHDCLTFVAPDAVVVDTAPDEDYLAVMIRGARHWSLPAGWVLGLEDFGKDPFFG